MKASLKVALACPAFHAARLGMLPSGMLAAMFQGCICEPCKDAGAAQQAAAGQLLKKLAPTCRLPCQG